MGERKKGFLEKVFSSSFKKDTGQSWAVILKGVPDKQSETNLVRLLTDQLNTSADDAAKIVQAVPIILFGNLTSHEAEQIKLRLNEIGARTGISKDPEELKGLPLVSWPKKITLQDLGGAINPTIPAPPPFLPPAAGSPPPSAPPMTLRPQAPLPPVTRERLFTSLPPKSTPSPSISPTLSPREKPSEIPPSVPAPSMPKPVIPSRPLPPASFPPAAAPAPTFNLPPLPPAEDWKAKFDQLQRSHAEVLNKLEKKELDLKEMQDHVRQFMQESESRKKEGQEATRERDRFRLESDVFQQEINNLRERLTILEKERDETLESLRTEMQQNASARDSLEKVIALLHAEKESMQTEVGGLLKSIKSDLEFRISELMRPIEPLKAHLKRIEVLLEGYNRLSIQEPLEGHSRRPPKTPPFNRP